MALDPIGNVWVSEITDNGEGAIHTLERSLYIKEKSPKAMVLFKLFANSQENKIHFAITKGNSRGAFFIDSLSGEMEVTSSKFLNYETNPDFQITIEFSNNAGYSSEEISISLLDENTPGVITYQPDSVSSYGALLKGEVFDEEGAVVTKRGFVFSHQPQPTIEDSVVYSGAGLGEFSIAVFCLPQDTTFFVRAFATNAYGTSFGNEVVFTTTERTAEAVLDSLWLDLQDTTAIVHWVSKLEVEPVIFIVEKAASDRQFSFLMEVQGNDCSNQLQPYAILDEAPFAGDNYSRLLHQEVSERQVIHDTLHFFREDPLAASGR